MKKITILMLMLGVAAFSSCNNDDDEVNIPASSLVLSSPSLSLVTADTATLSVEVEPSSLLDQIEWSSSNSDIAMVDGDGNILATGAGSVSVSASVGGKVAVCDVTVSAGVFVAGTITSQTGDVEGVIWRNNSILYSFSEDDIDYFCNTLFVEDGVVYSGGYQSSSTSSVATVWSGGSQFFEQSESGAYISSIFIDENTLYSAGSQYTTSSAALVWEDQTATSLPTSAYGSGANDIFVSGNTVYTVGYTINDMNNEVATIWEGTTPTFLGDSTVSSMASAVVVVDTLVYVAGHMNGEPMLWINGVSSPLDSISNGGKAFDVAVVGDDVYVAGYTQTTSGEEIPTYWLNGEVNNLSGTSDGGYINSIALDGNSIVMAGIVYSGANNIATQWVDGTAISLGSSGSNSSANQIFVQ